jgi:hypothetical protein
MVTKTLVLQPPGLSSASPVSETDRPSMTSPDDEAELLSRIAMQETQAFDTLYGLNLGSCRQGQQNSVSLRRKDIYSAKSLVLVQVKTMS